MIGLLRTRRWLGFTAVVVVSIIAFGLLSAWQWSRADQRRAERIALEGALSSQSITVEDAADAAAAEWRAVSVTGQYLPASQVGVRKRPLDTRNGFWVMTALDDGRGSIVWVNRGWAPAGADALSTPDFPAPPAGTVTVTGYLRQFDDATADRNDGLPAGQIAAPAPALLPAVGPSLPVYVQLATSSPAQEDLVPIPLPTVDEGRNVSYAIQWLLFAFVAVSGWFYFLRREAQEDAAVAAPQADTASTSAQER